MKKQTYNLGWTSLEYDDFENTDKLFMAMHYDFGNVLSKAPSLKRYARYKLQTPFYISEIENVIKHSIFLHEKIIIETPIGDSPCSSNRAYIDESYWEETVGCYFSYFSKMSLDHIFDQFGDAASDNEILLLPSFRPQWEEYDAYEDEDGNLYYNLEQSDPSELKYLLIPFNNTKPRLGKLENILAPMSAHIDREISNAGFKIPLLHGCSTFDIIKLRRDNHDSFLKWREYLDETLSSSNPSKKEINESIFTGIKELEGHIDTLKRKGYLDLVGATASAASIALVFSVGGQFSVAAGSLASIQLLMSSIKNWINHSKEKEKLKTDPFYLIWSLGKFEL